jgi:hypothetical protein
VQAATNNKWSEQYYVRYKEETVDMNEFNHDKYLTQKLNCIVSVLFAKKLKHLILEKIGLKIVNKKILNQFQLLFTYMDNNGNGFLSKKEILESEYYILKK